MDSRRYPRPELFHRSPKETVLMIGIWAAAILISVVLCIVLGLGVLATMMASKINRYHEQFEETAE